MAFVGVDDPLDVAVMRTQRIPEILAMLERHAVVLSAVGEQQRLVDARGQLDRRGGFELRGILALIANHLGHAEVLPPG